jgi:hypothetical protein
MCRKAEPRHGPTGKRGARNRPPDATAAENEESMARTKMNQRSANRVAVQMGATGGRTPPSKVTVMLLTTSIISAVWAAAMLTPFGRVAYVYFFAYSEYYMGVISLVALSITIMVGLVATDRLVLSIRQRVLLQSAHRTTGVIAVAALGVHLWTKIMEGHIRLIDTVVPFMSDGYNRIYVGLGTISGLLMVTVMWTGLARAWFVGRGRPWMWRSVHAISYLMWPVALMHGLSAGRPAATWVIVSYVLCVLAVLIGLAVRLSVSLNRRKDFSSSATGSIKPVGSLVPTTTPPARRPARRADAEDTGARMLSGRGAPADVLEQWVSDAPVSPAVSARPVGPPPISSPPYERPYEKPYERPSEKSYATPYERTRQRPGRTTEDERPYDEEPYRRGARSRRRADQSRYDEPRYAATRYDEPRYDVPRYHGPRIDEPERPEPRRALETGRRRAEYEPEQVSVPRPRRYAEDEPPRGRRHADEPPRGRHAEERHAQDEPRYEPAPRPRRRPDDEPRYEPAPPPRRRSADRGYDDAPRRAASGRHSRSEFVDLSDPDDPNYVPPDETPTLVDIAARRARRAAQQRDGVRSGGRSARRGRTRNDDGVADVQYWRQLRGEAQ